MRSAVNCLIATALCTAGAKQARINYLVDVVHFTGTPLLTGISGYAWAVELFHSTAEAYPNGCDYIFSGMRQEKKRSLVGAKFLPVRGTAKCFVRCMRLLLQMQPLGLSLGVARKFTCHSPRHFHPTVAGIRRLPPHERTAIGHWAPGSNMPVRYDASKGWSEVHAKQQNIDALRSNTTADVRSYSDDAWLKLPLLATDDASGGTLKRQPRRKSNP